MLFRHPHFAHQRGSLRHGNRIRNPPICRRIHNDAFGSILLDDFHHPLGTHFGMWVNGKCCPKAAIQYLFHCFLIVVIDHHPIRVHAVLQRHIHGTGRALFLVPVRGMNQYG